MSSPSPLALYRRAIKLLKQAPCSSTNNVAICDALEACIAALQSQVPQNDTQVLPKQSVTNQAVADAPHTALHQQIATANSHQFATANTHQSATAASAGLSQPANSAPQQAAGCVDAHNNSGSDIHTVRSSSHPVSDLHMPVGQTDTLPGQHTSNGSNSDLHATQQTDTAVEHFSVSSDTNTSATHNGHLHSTANQPAIVYAERVQHHVDLELEEPGFLLASAHLELGKLREKQGQLQAAVQQLQLSLQLFPHFVAAHLALALVLKQLAGSESDMQLVEHHLHAAVTSAERISKDDDMLHVNAACRKEMDAGTAARSALAMLLCQAGRDGEAARQLHVLDFQYRLSRQVLHYPTCSSANEIDELTGRQVMSDSRQYVQALDNALHPELLAHVQQAFSQSSPFWREHDYGRVGYFSYMHELGAPPVSSLHQLIDLLHKLVTKCWPAAANARYAEWWAHCRRHPSGHQLHFDSDDEGQGGVRNPIVSCVLYLTDGLGGPTLVTDQTLRGPLATRGWLVHPRINRLTMFDGKYLHGVIPGRGSSPDPASRRISLMVAFWEDIQHRPTPDGSPGASQVFPEPTDPRYTWQTHLPVRPEGWGTSEPEVVCPLPVSAVWQPVDVHAAKKAAPTYDACFQGF